MTIIAALANHLWQSTLFAGAAMLLAFALRNNRAHFRYWIWLAASIKFLVPFSLLVSAGALFEWRNAPVAAPPIVAAVSQISQPFEYSVIPSSAAPAASPSWPAVLGAVWGAGFLLILARWLNQWREVRAVLQTASPLSIPSPGFIPSPISVISTPALMEPGVFGVFRPVLVLPQGIADRLTQSQLSAILAHELCHIRRRDNLAAAFHMLVEAAFWFHPLVWWIGAKLVEERERACDEEVLRSGSSPEIYAQGILNVCRHYFESPLHCVSGVTGSDLKKRIEAIMTRRISQHLTMSRKLLLTAFGMMAVAGPVCIGIFNAPPGNAQSKRDVLIFEVASIRPSEPDQPNSRLGPLPGGGLQAKNLTLEMLITFAYNVKDFQVSGGPGWIRSARFDILAKPAKPEGPDDYKGMTLSQHEVIIERIRERTRNLLAERFQLKLHQDSKEAPVFALVVDKGGSKLKPSAEGGKNHMRTGRIQIDAEGSTMAMLAQSLSTLTGRKVVDQTGLNGEYDFKLQWTRDNGTSLPGKLRAPDEPDPAETPGSISIFTALQEQLGLKLESRKGTVEQIVIDHAEKPTEN